MFVCLYIYAYIIMYVRVCIHNIFIHIYNIYLYIKNKYVYLYLHHD